ncbi:MAG: cytosine permease [Conexivisphaerales archaeon]
MSEENKDQNEVDRRQITKYYDEKGYVELEKKFPEERYLWNEDFHPTPVKYRNWGTLTYFAIWFGMSIEVESWALVSIGYSFGLNWFWGLMAVLIGNLIVLIPILIISHGGARYGIPETPLTRSRWGIYGNWIPSLLRGIIGAGWWGIDTWIITEAIGAMYIIATHQVATLYALAVQAPADLPFLIATINPLLFWSVFIVTILARLLILYVSPPSSGQRTLKIISWSVPFIAFGGFLILFFSIMGRASWQWTSILSIPTTVSGSTFWYALIGLINANVAFWATMALSMPDYSRFAKNQFAQTFGQLPMPFLMTAIGAFALVTTGASYAVFKFPIWDPVVLTALSVSEPWLAYTALFLLLLGVIIVNIYADTVGPGYDFSNLYPKKLSWFKGVIIVVVVAALMQSWTYYFSAFSYVENWLLTYGALLGGVEGVIIFDYAVVRRFKFELSDNYMSHGRFRYWKGFNPAAVISFIIAMILVFPPNTYLPISISQLYPGQLWIFQNAWISAILITGILYLPLMKYWIIPRYQPELKGGLTKGYIADDTKDIFSAKSKNN